MADWIEEGAGIPYGVTIREATTEMITMLKKHCKPVSKIRMPKKKKPAGGSY